MKRLNIGCTLFYSALCLCTLSFLNTSQACQNTPTNKQKLIQTIDYVEQMGREIYCYWDLKKEHDQVNWQDIIKQAKSKVSDTTTQEEFQEILNRIAAGVHDGHVNYIYQSKHKPFYLPIEFKKLEDGYYVKQVEQEKLWPITSEITPGDKVLAINDIPIEQFIEEREKIISGSTAIGRQSKAASSLNSLPRYVSAPANNHTLTVEKYLSKIRHDVTIPWVTYSESQNGDKALSDIVQSQILPENVGLLKLTSMHHATGQQSHIRYIQKELKALKNTDALIIDVRNNGGGYGEIGDAVIAHFIKQPVKRYKAQLKNSTQAIYARPGLLEVFTQTDPDSYEYSEWVDYDIEPLNKKAPVYSKPVYILTNERCFSACDTFVDSFSSNHLGEVLGHQTGGGTGYPLWFELPYEQGHFRFSILRGYSNHDRFLEGIGTLPDKEFYATPGDLYNEIDGELVRAYHYVLGQLQQDASGLTPQMVSHEALFKNKKTDGVIPFFEEEMQWQEAQKHY